VVEVGSLAECVVNISEGRDQATIDAVGQAGGPAVLDVHSDPEHHRSVVTLGGPLEAVEDAARRVVASAVAHIDLRDHVGIHPRLGAADVVPFVPLPSLDSSLDGSARWTDERWSPVVGARDRFAHWAGTELEVPCFLYGPERSLPDIRRTAFHPLKPDTGPPEPHPTAGSMAVGARAVLIAYNIWIAAPAGEGPDGGPARALSVARSLAADLRTPSLRSLGLPVDGGAQVSCNLTEPATTSVAAVYDAVADGAESMGCSVLRAELVGLMPAAALEQIPRRRWPELDLDADRTIEGRLRTAS
jgi:glutamate formiminotransferase / 5-formyltetrahydrofolate cyclo-ligase